jgi:hypothetical protein
MIAGGPRSFSAGGCEIPDGTPKANLLAQKRALRDLERPANGRKQQPHAYGETAGDASGYSSAKGHRGPA